MGNSSNLYDLIIIGGGPAGLTAAIYGGRAKLKTLVINKGTVGGLVNATREIVNYPGYGLISGTDLMKDFKKHADSFGAEFVRDEVISADFTQERKLICTKKGGQYMAPAVIIACGSQPRLLNIPGERRLRGNGVAYCATCDADFFQDEHVVIVGSGDQAIEEGMYITKFASKVTVIVLHDVGMLDCNKVSAERALCHEKMEFIWNSTIEEVLGEESVRGVIIKNLKTASSRELACQGVFFFVGMIPATQFLQGSGMEMDQRGYIQVNNMFETSIEGVYAAGDNRITYLRQVVSAAGDGAAAAVAAERYLEELHAFNRAVQREKKLLLLFFSPLSDESLRFVTVLEDINSTLTMPYSILKVDVTTKKTLARKYNIQTVPFVVAVKDGEELQRIDGTANYTEIKQQLNDN